MLLQFVKAPPELISLVLPEMIVSAVSIATGQVTSLLGCLRLCRGESMCKIYLCYILFEQHAFIQRSHFASQSGCESGLAPEKEKLGRFLTDFTIG